MSPAGLDCYMSFRSCSRSSCCGFQEYRCPSLAIAFFHGPRGRSGLARHSTAAGLLFTVWARIHIGRNWSGTVTIKEGHELITSGPYAIVRHPIYAGLLLAFVGSGLARGEWRGVLAVVIAFLALWRKLRLEERWMREQFGPAYQAYSQRVAALIPFLF